MYIYAYITYPPYIIVSLRLLKKQRNENYFCIYFRLQNASQHVLCSNEKRNAREITRNPYNFRGVVYLLYNSTRNPLFFSLPHTAPMRQRGKSRTDAVQVVG